MPGTENPLRQRIGIEARPVPQGALLVDMNTGRCFRLNRVGAEIWKMLQTPLAVGEVCGRIAARYQRPIDQINAEVRALFDLLIREQLVEIAAETSPRAP